MVLADTPGTADGDADGSVSSKYASAARRICAKRFEMGLWLAYPRMSEAIQLWDNTYRKQSVRFEIPANRGDDSDPERGRFFLGRPHNSITVIWQ